MKQLKALLSADPNLLDNAVGVRVRQIRHFILLSDLDSDPITIPLCGNIEMNTMAKQRIHGVTCIECLQRLKAVAVMDTFEEVSAYVKEYAPTVMQPDLSKVGKKVSGMLTPESKRHTNAKEFLRIRKIPTADRLHENIIGTEAKTFFHNMLHLELVDDEGEPIIESLDALQEQIDVLSESEQ